MPAHPDREHFIPLRVPDLLAFLAADRGPGGNAPLDAADWDRFRRLADVVAARVHARYLARLRRLKDDYAPFDPDPDTRRLREPTDVERAVALTDLFRDLTDLMARANYRRLSRPDLEALIQGASAWGVDMHVAWDCFDKVEVFVRGAGLGKRTRRKWYRLFRTEQVTVPTFDRVVVMFKQRPHPMLGPGADTRSAFLKLFKDIPRMDVEMLLPGTRIKMPLLDRLRLGGSGVGSFGYAFYKISSMPVGAAVGALFGKAGLVGLLTLYTPVMMLAGYGYNTYYNFQVTRNTYQLQLHQSLYYQNLDNNAGVLHRMLDEAEEQETREVLLGYFYLWRYAGTDGWTAAELDAYVELDLERRLGLAVDFEVADALGKLERGGLAVKVGELWSAVPVADAVAALEAAAGQPEPPTRLPDLARAD